MEEFRKSKADDYLHFGTRKKRSRKERQVHFKEKIVSILDDQNPNLEFTSKVQEIVIALPANSMKLAKSTSLQSGSATSLMSFPQLRKSLEVKPEIVDANKHEQPPSLVEEDADEGEDDVACDWVDGFAMELLQDQPAQSVIESEIEMLPNAYYTGKWLGAELL